MMSMQSLCTRRDSYSISRTHETMGIFVVKTVLILQKLANIGQSGLPTLSMAAQSLLDSLMYAIGNARW